MKTKYWVGAFFDGPNHGPYLAQVLYSGPKRPKGNEPLRRKRLSRLASREEEISIRQFNFSLKTVVGDRRPPTRRHPPPAAMEFAVVEGESFSPCCSTLVMV
jgi:hypothetical protein